MRCSRQQLEEAIQRMQKTRRKKGSNVESVRWRRMAHAGNERRCRARRGRGRDGWRSARSGQASEWNWKRMACTRAPAGSSNWMPGVHVVMPCVRVCDASAGECAHQADRSSPAAAGVGQSVSYSEAGGESTSVVSRGRMVVPLFSFLSSPLFPVSLLCPLSLFLCVCLCLSSSPFHFVRCFDLVIRDI